MTERGHGAWLLAVLIGAIGVGVGLALGLLFLALAGGQVLLDVIEVLLASPLGTIYLLAIVVTNFAWVLSGVPPKRIVLGNLLLVIAGALAFHLTTFT